MDAKEAWKALYGKDLNTKNHILEYIDITKIFKQPDIPAEKVQDTYNFIYKSIEDLGGTVKVNTKLHLKNQLKAQLGKYVSEKDPKPINYFVEFFKEAYPPSTRRKDFTWVLMDVNKITDEQIWTTLAYINGWLLKEDNKLSENQKKDIVKIIELLVRRKNVKFINNTRSLEKLLSSLNIKIVTLKEGFKVKRQKDSSENK
ncbi:hypothetical protein NBE98_06425 [Clostridium swellfunianum]|uniref:hypothetical protein n=1 Tax=Clostridium swellfunianum TaxID=1367462 RepID=UPI00202F8496|nr:hypothetical protein [Clostridium swellfunianum]MCM0648006.1 hypothetical protein [Clostridium swellfunianum]